jgi:DNA processing protein
MNKKEAWIALNLIGISRSALSRLIDYFEDPQEVLRGAFEEISEVTTPKTAKKIAEFEIESALEKELNLIEKTRARTITIEDQEYPENLKNIYDPPIILYTLGEFQPEDRFGQPITERKWPVFLPRIW